MEILITDRALNELIKHLKFIQELPQLKYYITKTGIWIESSLLSDDVLNYLLLIINVIMDESMIPIQSRYILPKPLGNCLLLFID